MSSAVASQHHHRSTTKAGHKAFKARFASKSALKDKAKGKVERIEKGTRTTPHQHVMNKLDRRNQAKQKRLNHSHGYAAEQKIFAGRDGAPRVVAVIPLCKDVSASTAIQTLNSSLDINEDVPFEGISQIQVDRFKQKLAYISVRRGLVPSMDACRAADYVLFVLSAEEEVDELGEAILKAVETQGISNVFVAVQGLESLKSTKRKTDVQASLKEYFRIFFPAQEKVISLDSRQECQNIMRSLCSTVPKGIRWREDRGWMFIENLQWTAPNDTNMNAAARDVGDVTLTGVVRGRNLKADRLVQIGDWGEFQISRIISAPVSSGKEKMNDMAIDDLSLDQPTEGQDTLEELAPEEVSMIDADDTAPSTTMSERKAVLLDDHQYYSDEENENFGSISKRLPRGTSKYQAAWYLGDISDSGSDLSDAENFDEDDEAMEDVVGPADGLEGAAAKAMTETMGAPTEYAESEMFLDPSPDDEAPELAAYRARRKEEAEEDRQFPDEIEMEPNVLARERLSRYRGLKSLRTSPWDSDEDKPYEPNEWSRLLEIQHYNAAYSKVLRETLVGGVKPGTRVHVTLRNVPLALQQTQSPPPIALYALLRHEHKRTAANFNITLRSDYPEPLKSKSELIMRCGSRQYIINPLFSTAGNTPNNVHKFERYLHPGRNAIASFMGPLTWGATPALFFQRSGDGESLKLVAHGTSIPPSQKRVIAKRVVLTGTAFKIHRKLVTVRYMFFNAEDVAWFRALPLWTNHGRQGVIRDSLGTHGYFKATFDAKIGMQDAIGVSLYKRVWPRPARAIDNLSSSLNVMNL